MRPANLAVWLWAILFPMGWISLMAGLTEDDGPPRMMVIWFFGAVGLAIWVIGLVVTFLIWTAHRRKA